MDKTVNIKGCNKYMSAEGGGGGQVHVNRDAAKEWEQFKITQIEGEQHVFITTLHGFYLCAEGGGGSGVSGNRYPGKEWERFTIRDANSGQIISVDQIVNGMKVTIQAPNGNYFCAEGGGGGDLNSNRQTAGDWEKFIIVIPSVTYPFRDPYPRAKSVRIINATNQPVDLAFNIQWNGGKSADSKKVGSSTGSTDVTGQFCTVYIAAPTEATNEICWVKAIDDWGTDKESGDNFIADPKGGTVTYWCNGTSNFLSFKQQA
jgi:hypothetical protein